MPSRTKKLRAFILIVAGALIGCQSDPEPAAPADDRPAADGGAPPGATPDAAPAPADASGSALASRAADRERAAERRLREAVTAAGCDAFLKEITSRTRLAGSRANQQSARFLETTLTEMGYQVERHEYQVQLPHPIQVAVELTAPVAFAAAIVEEGVRLDSDTYTREAVTPFNAFTPDCDLTAAVVYANYGRREDYATLATLGVSVRDKIVVARAGAIYRGSKAHIAEENGAAGLLLYSDPADDGFGRGDVYPDGPFRPARSVERGSILYIFDYPGDPGTPGRPSVAGADQLTFDEMTSLPAIPTTCLSAADTEPILRHLEGLNVPEGWQGGMPFPYHVGGGGRTKVRLRLEMDNSLRNIADIVATWPGLECPDEEIIVGNHRDAWVFGAVDAASGTAVLLEAARALADAARDGHPPQRTVRFAFWDAEEFGIIGSTEFGEEHARDLDKRCVAYLNFDAAVSGPKLRLGGVPSLRSFIEGILGDIPSPSGTGRWRDELLDDEGRLPYGRLGSGSDYTVFLDHLGIASLDFSSSGDYGVYHSLHDTYGYVKRFSDPGFETHAAMSRLLVTLLSRLSRCELLPFDFAAVGESIARSAREVEATQPRLELAEIEELAAAIAASGRGINAARSLLAERELGREVRARLNARLYRAERTLLLPQGLPGRPWFRHALFAPDADRGYGAALLPPLTEAIAGGDRDAIQRAATSLATVLRSLHAWLEETRRMMESLLRS